MMRLDYSPQARAPYYDPDFNDAEYERRIAAVRAGLAEAKLDAIIVYCGVGSYASLRWLTNFQPVFGAAFVVVRADGGVIVTTNGMLHAEPMHSMVWNCRAAEVRCAAGPVYGGAVDEVATLAADAAADLRHVGLGNSALIPQQFHAVLASRLPGLRAADAVITNARLIKSAAEIAVMEESGKIADAAFDALFARLAPGVLETECAAAVVETMYARGAIESFRTCVVGGKLAGLKHAYARERKLEKGEMVFLDLGASYRGYASDTSLCAVVGEKPSGEAKGLLSIADDLYDAGLEEMKPGRTIDDIAQKLIRVVKGTKYEKDFYASGFGHGIGMDLFEAPGGLFAGSKAELKPGMTVAYEPMVVVEGLGTGVVENTILITETGHRLLTRAPRSR
ncbi:Xaa-Pro peptidase family protein [Terrarubrum flagellatum]|uniref:M24 family metallopeptidase n=1 Tax=Terrirubrum flagellatum TaxID=2895980 RepID=UPI00314531CA